MRNKKAPAREWMPADSALWRTCHIVHDISERRVPEYRVPTLFPMAPNEISFTNGPIIIDEFRADGDGSYVHSTGFAFGTGVFGLALAAASIAGNASANASRRAQAQADAAVAWRPEFRGDVVVTSQGFYLLGPSGLLRWDWHSIDLMQVVSHSTVVLQGRSNRGPVVWRIFSDWAELVFVLWAMARHPQHPQLLDGTWLPAGWAEWSTAQGYPPHPGGGAALTGS